MEHGHAAAKTKDAAFGHRTRPSVPSRAAGSAKFVPVPTYSLERSGALRRCRSGATLLDLLVAMLLAAVLMGVAIPRLRGSIARHATRAAADDVSAMLSAARQIAATSADGASVGFHAASATARLVVAGDTVRTLALGSLHGVTLRTTRDSIAYDARGLGYGAANASVMLSRGTAAETLVVSRLGRLRSSHVP